MRSTLRVLLFAAFVAGVAARHSMFGGRWKGGFVHLQDSAKSNVHIARPDSGVSGSAKFDQILDHFNDGDTRTFKQRYFWNSEKSSVKSFVNIIYLPERTAEYSMISGDKPVVAYAEKFAANLYALEHRYYGESHAFDDTSVKNLKFLSSHQAIEDIAHFIKTLNANSGNPSEQKWILVGGSYSGNIAAWARAKYPELVTGSIASSASLLAQVDFYGYLETVNNNVAQNAACYKKLQDGIDTTIGNFGSSNGRTSLDNKFPTSPKITSFKDLQDNDIAAFFGYVIDIFERASQYGTPKSVADLCTEFTNSAVAGTDPMDALAYLYKTYYTENGKVVPMNINYTAMVEEMSDTSYDSDDTERIWFWQACTEFGYFQTTDRGTQNNVFQSIIPINTQFDFCQDVFGIDTNAVKKAIDDTNEYYGGRDYYAGTNVIFSHGTADPWSYLTKQMGTSQHWSVVIVEVAGGTHCQDLNAPCDSNGVCNPELQRVQTLTMQLLDQWLNGPFCPPNSINITDNVGKRPAFYGDFVPPPRDVKQNECPQCTAPQANRAKRSVSKNLKQRRHRGWNVFVGKRDHFLLPPPPVENSMQRLGDWPVSIEEGRVSQPWDHFDTNNINFFQQKFYMNDQYVKVENGAKIKTAPNFLMIGGEEPESDSWVKNEQLAWMQYAKEVGATLYILEHRYYGESKLGTRDLQYLTSAQMLYDVASFINIVKRDRGVTGPWITFGGSYPGALAAWSREWFPELILGAVGSSGPVLAKTDFFEYLQVVENVLRDKSAKCAARVREAFDKLRQLSHDPAGRATISNKFKLDPEWKDNNEIIPQQNIQNVFGNLYGVFQDIVQYSDDNNKKGNDYTVRELCELMEDETRFPDSLDAVRYVQKWVYDDYGEPATGSDPEEDFTLYRDMLNYIDGKGEKRYSDGDLAGVLWTWQTCNEFGYYQTTDYGQGIFGNPVTLNFFILMCEEVFGVTMDHVEAGVARSNYQYGGRAKYNTTNVVLSNGNHDPWHALGILEQGTLPESVVPIVIEGTAHCADMYASRAEDPQQLRDARTTILNNIKQWLTGEKPTVSPPTSPTTEMTTTSASHLSTIAALLVPLALILL